MNREITGVNRKVIAITGGIATGKSTVTGIFEKLGGFVISADEIAHEVIRKGKPAYRKIIKAFGRSILDGHGEIIRRELGKVVFGRASFEVVDGLPESHSRPLPASQMPSRITITLVATIANRRSRHHGRRRAASDAWVWGSVVT